MLRFKKTNNFFLNGVNPTFKTDTNGFTTQEINEFITQNTNEARLPTRTTDFSILGPFHFIN